MNRKKPFAATARAACLCVPLVASGLAVAAQQADPALPAGPGGAAGAAVQPPPSVTSSALSGISDLSLSWSGYFQALAVLCFVLAMVWALLWLLKRHGKGPFLGTSPILRIESRLALGPKKWLMVIRYMDRRLLVGMTDENISLLVNAPAENQTPEKASAPSAQAAAVGNQGAPAGGGANAIAESGKDKSLDQLFSSLLRGGQDDGSAAK